MFLSRCFLLLLFLTAVQAGHGGGQSCVDKQQVEGVLRQMERFLKGQEQRFNEAFRIMKSKIALLHNSVTKLPQADQSAAPSTCPPLEDPVHGRKFGSKYVEGHEVHFTCSHGYHLVGTGTRVCQENGSWSGVNAICTDVNECSSAPCLNGGTCVTWRGHYRCTCPQSWSGSHCQHQTQTVVPKHSKARRMKAKLPLLSRPALPEWSVMDDPAFSRRPRCTKVDRAQHCSCDAGFHMSGTSDSSICQDVNECEVFRLDQGGKLCAHVCVNVPGSYHCTCPRGYQLLSDSRSCEDVDECLSQQHNCSRGTTCINTGGGFQCVNPDCPNSHGNVSYIKTSPFQCERNPCPMDSRSCHLAPKTVSFHFLPLPSALQTPATLFRMATAAPPSPPSPGRSGPDSLRFGIVGGNPRGLFVMQRSDRQTGELILVQPIQGPLEVSVEVDMAEYSDRVFQAKHLARVTLLVSAYNF